MRYALLRPLVLLSACLIPGPPPAAGDAPNGADTSGPSEERPLCEIAPISGLALIEQSDARGARYIAVHDTKNKIGGKAGPWLSVIGVEPGKKQGPKFRPVAVDWPGRDEGRYPNDLEAVCAVPGTGPEPRFLLLESSYYRRSYGRIFDVTLSYDGNGWHGRVNRIIKLPSPDAAAPDPQEYPHNFEAIACFSAPDDQLVVVLGDHKLIDSRKGTVVKDADLYAAWITAGAVDVADAGWQKIASISSPGFRREKDFRHCSDFYAERAGEGRYRLWVSAAMDPNDDDGPFYSEIHCAGTIQTKAVKGGGEGLKDLFTPGQPEGTGS